MTRGRKLIRLALFGHPVKSSLSPAIQRMFASQFGLDIEYHCIETRLENFAQALEAFRVNGGIGCNVTVPLKREAWRLATKSSVAVSRAEAANTLVYEPSGGWYAHNTDGLGLLADLRLNHAIVLADQRVLVLGAGGATAGILGNLLAAAPAEILLVNRDIERAHGLVKRFIDAGKLGVTSWQGLSGHGRFDLVINATSLGHQGKVPALNGSSFAPGALCYDLNYAKASQPLKKLCEDMGQRYLDGLGMLVEQAAESFCIWTGNRPDCEKVIPELRSTID